MLTASLLFMVVASGRASSNSGAATSWPPAWADTAKIPTPHVWEIAFEGNKTFKKLVLRDVVAVEPPNFWKKLLFWRPSGTAVSDMMLKKDVIRLQRFYQRRGFEDVKVDYRIRTKAREWKKEIVFVIRENNPIRIKDLAIRYQTDPATVDFLKRQSSYQRALERQSYQEERRYAMIHEPDVKGTLILALKNLGYAYADVGIETRVDSVQNVAEVSLDIVPGPRTKIDSISVTGRYTVSEDMIRRNSGLHIGEYFSEKKLQNAQRELFNHPLFRFATISIPEQPEDSSLILQIRVREHEKRSIGVKIGGGRDDIIRGEVTWTHRNVANYGHRFSATANASFIEQQISTDYLFPYVFNEKSSFLVNPFAQHQIEPNYELSRWGINNSLIYQYRRNITASISYEFTRNYELAREQNYEFPDSIRTYNISAVQLSGFYTTDLRQSRGWMIQPFMEFSGFLGSASFDFQKFMIDIRRYVDLTGSTKLAGRVKTGTLFYNESDSLPNPIRYYAGGTYSVRGWDWRMLGPKRAIVNDQGQFEKYIPVGGHSVFAFNLELRQRFDWLIDGFALAGFLDGGQVWHRLGGVGNRMLRYSTGGGFRYDSPIGPVRLDVGYKLNPSEKDLDIYQGQDYGNFWDKIGIHFSIGQAF